MASTPDIPDPITPAPKPERVVDVQPDDIELGSTGSETVAQGKNRLKRPSTSSSTAGLQV